MNLGFFQETAEAFSRSGLACPDLYNPAEHYVNMTSNHQINLRKKILEDKLVDLTESRAPSGMSSTVSCKFVRETSWLEQLWCLMQRSTKTGFRSYRNQMIESSFYLVRKHRIEKGCGAQTSFIHFCSFSALPSSSDFCTEM